MVRLYYFNRAAIENQSRLGALNSVAIANQSQLGGDNEKRLQLRVLVQIYQAGNFDQIGRASCRERV